ncbi:MAG: sensor histidine kinase [Enterocloster bolteae]
MRFSSRLNVDVRHDRKLEQAVTLPRFTLQPLVENAVIHGLEPKEEGGTLILDVRKTKLYKDTDLRQWNGYGKGTPGEDQEASFGETAGTDWSLEYMAEAFLIYGQG